MAITRRGFLRTGALGGLIATVPLVANNAFGQKINSPPKGSPSGSKDSTFINTEILSFITASVFEEYVGTSFLIRTDALNTHKLELEQVKLGKDTERLESFSLLFSSPDEEQFPQASYLFEHEKIGLFPLFIVSVRTPKGMRYEAVFNRLRGAAK